MHVEAFNRQHHFKNTQDSKNFLKLCKTQSTTWCNVINHTPRPSVNENDRGEIFRTVVRFSGQWWDLKNRGQVFRSVASFFLYQWWGCHAWGVGLPEEAEACGEVARPEVWVYLKEPRPVVRLPGLKCGFIWRSLGPWWGCQAWGVGLPEGAEARGEVARPEVRVYLNELKPVVRLPGLRCRFTWRSWSPWWGCQAWGAGLPEGAEARGEVARPDDGEVSLRQAGV